MLVNGSQAMVPKARGMYAKRVKPAEYEELMRRRTVPEVAALLKKHPYFGDNLATLSPSDPHREQVEELLGMDIFVKYEQLLHYEFREHSFSEYFIIECEVREILRALRLLSAGVVGRYIKTMPPFLEGRLRFDLFAVAEAASFEELMEVLRHTPYYKVLREYWLRDPMLKDYPAAEAVMIHYYYSQVFNLAKQYLSGREEKAVRNLFLQEVENYNISIILRAKTFFGAAFAAQDIQRLLIPYTYRISKRRLDDMVEAKGIDLLLALYRQSGLDAAAGPANPDEFDASGGRVMYHHARRVLHLSSAPSAALAAFITLAKLERDNVVNVVEGVRYNLSPEKIRALLRF